MNSLLHIKTAYSIYYHFLQSTCISVKFCENRYLLRLALDFGLRLSGLRILLEMALLMLPLPPPPPLPLLLLLLEVRRLMSILCSTSPANKPCSASIDRKVQINWS